MPVETWNSPDVVELGLENCNLVIRPHKGFSNPTEITIFGAPYIFYDLQVLLQMNLAGLPLETYVAHMTVAQYPDYDDRAILYTVLSYTLIVGEDWTLDMIKSDMPEFFEGVEWEPLSGRWTINNIAMPDRDDHNYRFTIAKALVD